MFKLIHKDKRTKARLGKLTTAHGVVNTPEFMPVATQATIKTLSVRDLKDCKLQIILSNAYHLYLRPGVEIIKEAGGLHKFMAWDKPILTDSGGFQVFSLSRLVKVHDEGVKFQSHFDGSWHKLTPEDVVDIQKQLGSDIMMPLDECVEYPCEKDRAELAMKRTVEWAKRSWVRHCDPHRLDSVCAAKRISGGKQSPRRLLRPLRGGSASLCSRADFVGSPRNDGERQLLFGIIQGSSYLDLRKECAERLIDMDLDGYAIGGVSVGEPKDIISEITAFTADLLPQEESRYLMGVGEIPDILQAVSCGIDMFDCVIPTRNGRNSVAFTRNGPLVLRDKKYTRQFAAIDQECGCFTCRTHTRAYLRHLYKSEELLALSLISLHNIHFYAKIMREIREAIKKDKFSEYKRALEKTYNK